MILKFECRGRLFDKWEDAFAISGNGNMPSEQIRQVLVMEK